MATAIEIEVPGRMQVVDDLEAILVWVANRAGLDPDAAHFLGVALREALINAIRHGKSLDAESSAAEPPVQVCILDEGGCLSVSVRDWGRGFDPDMLPDPAAPENQKRGSGRGIFFMRQFADEVVFRQPDGGGQVVELRKRLR